MLSLLTLLSIACTFVHGLYIPDNQGHGASKQSDASNKDSGVEATAVSLNFAVTKRHREASDFWPRMVEGIEKRHFKRDKEVALTNYQDVIYHIDVNVGNSKCTVSLDTGSSDLWVWGSQGKGEGGQYDTSSGKNTGQKFEISYLDSTAASGNYYTDSFGFDGETLLKDFQFGVVTDSNDDSFGILGIGNKDQEASTKNGGSTYDNLPFALKSAGVIKSAAYSLWLNGGGQNKGTILFGGKDESMYSGDLVTYPVDSSTSGLAIQMSSMSIDGKSFNVGAPVLLDSGTTGGILPKEIMDYFDEIFHPNKVTPSNGLVERYVDCKQPTDKFIEFDFGKNKIRASYQDVVMKFAENKCMLGFTDYQDRYILGDAFLRNAYVYYDLDKQEISLAQSKNSGSSNDPAPSPGSNSTSSIQSAAPTSLTSPTANGTSTAPPTGSFNGASTATEPAPSEWEYPGANPTSGQAFPAPTGGESPDNGFPSIDWQNLDFHAESMFTAQTGSVAQAVATAFAGGNKAAAHHVADTHALVDTHAKVHVVN